MSKPFPKCLVCGDKAYKRKSKACLSHQRLIEWYGEGRVKSMMLEMTVEELEAVFERHRLVGLHKTIPTNILER